MSSERTPEEIRDEMDRIRGRLPTDVRRVATNAREMTNWKQYVRLFPWGSLAAVTAIGYLVVPRRLEIVRPDEQTLEKLAAKHKLVVQQDPQPHKKGGIMGALFTLVANAAVRGLISYIGQKGGKVSGQKAAEATDPGSPRSARPR